MKQAEVILLTKDDLCNKETRPTVRLYNEYFGGGMSSIVFQDMRESKALAYRVFSLYFNASRKDDYNYVFSSVSVHRLINCQKQ